MGDTATAAELTAAAEPFIASLPTFWNGDYLIGMDDRQLDSSVVLAINNAFMGTPAEANFSFTAPWVVATVAAHTALSDKMFPINVGAIPRWVDGWVDGWLVVGLGMKVLFNWTPPIYLFAASPPPLVTVLFDPPHTHTSGCAGH